MSQHDKFEILRQEMNRELTDRVLPFWREHTVDLENGGFVGRITQEGRVELDAPKGAVLNARILWTFSASARLLGTSQDLQLASRAHRYLCDRFLDPSFGGVYWMVDSLGEPLDTTKKIYAQSFAIYGLAEKFRADGDSLALDEAIQLFQLVERHAHDVEHGGYFEAFGREWDEIEDVRLGEDDDNAPKSMNTQLHVLEAYTNLFRCWPSDILRDRLRSLVRIHLDQIVDPDRHQMRLFFEADWTPRSSSYSYGHDIEAAWLLLDAADALGDHGLREDVREAAIALARSTHALGQDEDGGIYWAGDATGPIDTDKHWWAQAEAVVGFKRAFDETGDDRFAQAALAAWTFTKENILDLDRGEWFGRVSRNRIRYAEEDKVGLWKCPYHNARACLEMGLPKDPSNRVRYEGAG